MKGEIVPILQTAAANKKALTRAKPGAPGAPVALEIDMKEAQALRKRVVEHLQILQKLQKAFKK